MRVNFARVGYMTCQGSTWGSLRIPMSHTTCGHEGDVVIVPSRGASI